MKHSNYNNPCKLTIKKNSKYGMYTLEYEDEGYSLYGTKEDILDELGAHMENMTNEGDK